MKALRRAAATLHRVVGLVLGLVLLVLSLSGSALVFRHEIDRALHPELLTVRPGPERVALDEVLRIAAVHFPEDHVRILRWPRGPEDPVELYLAPSGRQAYVDPYRGEVLGARGETEHLMGWLFALHHEFLGGETGERFVGVAGLLLVILSLSGLVVWWPGRRKIRLALTVARGRGVRRTLYDLHRAAGFYSVLFLLAAGLTGAGLVFYQTAGVLLNGFDTSFAERPPVPASTPVPGAPTVPLQAAIETARQALPGAAITFVTPSVRPDAPVTVRMRTPGKWHPNGRSYVYVDAYSGAVLRVDDERQASRGTRALQALYPLHIGSVGGLALRVLYLLLGLTPAFLAVTGTYVWWSRRRAAHGEPASRRPAAPLPGAVRPVRQEEVHAADA